MQRPRFKVLRFMALAAMILSLSGVFGLMPAATAEEGADAPVVTTDLPADSGEGTTPEGDTGDGASEGDSTGADPVVIEGEEGSTDGGEPVVTEGSEPVVTESTANRQAAPAADGGMVQPMAAGGFVGRVVNDTGVGIDGATVRLVSPSGPTATTSGGGFFLLTAGSGINNGVSYSVEVEAAGFYIGTGSATASCIPFLGCAGDFGTIQLDPLPAPGVMTVVVLDAANAPITTATVAFDGIAEGGTVNPDGSFTTSTTYDPGTYTFTASAPGYNDFDGSITIVDGNAGTTVNLNRTVLDAVLFVDPAVDGSYTGSCGGAPVSGQFFGGTAVMGQVYEGAYCAVTLTAAGYEDGSAAGYITDEDNNNSGFISGSLGTALPTHFPVTLTVLPSDSGDATGAWYAVYDNVNPTPIAAGQFTDSHTVSLGDLPNGTYTVHVDGRPIGYTFASGPYTVNGAAADWGIAIDPIPLYDINGGVVEIGTYAQIEGATVELRAADGVTVLDSTTTAADGTFSFTDLEPGTYYMPVTKVGYELGGGTVTITNADVPVGFALTPLVAPTYPISGIVTDLETGDPIEGAEIFVDSVGDDDAGDFSALALVGSTTTNADGEYSISVPDGTYDVYVVADGYYTEYATITVDGDGQIRDFQLEPYEEWTTGFLEVQKFYCDDVDTVSFNAGVADDDCETGAAYFTIYMYGDGTADYVPLHVWESGWGYIELEEGTYTLVEEGSNAKYDFEIVAGDWTYVEVVNPGEAPAPRDGTVNISTFLCNNISETIFTSDAPGVLMAAAGLPTFEPACDPVATDVTFYLVGDGTADYWQVTTKGGKGTIVLAPGTYEVVEERTQAHYFIEVIAGDFISLDIQIPAGGEVTDGTSINISKFYCDTLTEVEWLSLTDAEYSDRDELHGAPKCRPGIATFTFYLYGDGTDAYAQIKVYGAGSIGLAPGSYLVVEEETQATFDLEVLEGENTLLRVNNPMPDDGEYPGKPDYDKDKKHKKHDKHGKDKTSTTKTVDVTKLPETGAGSSESTDALAMAVAAAAMAAGAGALRLRKDT